MASKAIIETVPNLVSSMMPFLYHTRTLASFQARASIRRKVCRAGCRRQFSCGIPRYVDNSERVEAVTTNAAPDEKENRGPRIIRTTIMHGSNPKFSGNFYGQQNSPRSAAEPQWRERSSARSNFSQPDYAMRRVDLSWDTTEMDNDFEDAESNELYDEEDDVFMDEYEDDAWTRKSEDDRETTITPTEQQAFDAMFKNIHARMKMAQRYDDDFAGDLPETDDPSKKSRNPERKSVRKRTANATLESIMGEALGSKLPRTREEKEIIVNRYPPVLRAAAAKAVGLDFDESHYEAATKQEEEALGSDQLEGLRKPIREAVEAKMNAAKTDVELWNVMEQDVFPLIRRLGLEGRDKKNEPAPKKRSRKVKKADSPSSKSKTLKIKEPRLVLPPEEERSILFEPTIHEGQVVAPLTLYGPLYPSYLLLGLRLLDRSFTKPSPLTLCMLPKIKSLGLISHVLGASTQLYNELLIVYWYRNDDFRGVNTLLYEMEQSGLTFNKETFDIVDDICKMQTRILRGDRGTTLQALWTLPEFAPGKFTPWFRKIQRALEDEHRLAY
jgi:hypothetical protein